MPTIETHDLRYPVGKFHAPPQTGPAEIALWLDQIAAVPAQLRATLDGLSAAQAELPYRPGGWTVRQVVHHLPDSHLNAYTRFKLALTEDRPVVKPYQENAWAELEDTRLTPLATSVILLTALHDRWVRLMRTLEPVQWNREWVHPESGARTLAATAALYAWHGRHHLAHIEQALRTA